jgi:hypothetical protein
VYKPADGCSPPSGPWEGSPLSETPWLKKFADHVVESPPAAQAWRDLEQKIRKDDLRSLIELLYLFTVAEDTVVDKLREYYLVLNRSLEPIIAVYDLIDSLSDLMKSSFAAWFDENLAEAHHLIAGRALAHELREGAVTFGSPNENIRNYYLVFMAAQLNGATGTSRLSALRSLIKAAYAAHGKKTAVPEPNSLGRNILRFRERHGIGNSPPTL